MPIHDWSRTDAGCFQHFHLSWVCRIADALNRSLGPKGMTALLEPSCGWPIPAALKRGSRRSEVVPPSDRTLARRDRVNYAKRKDRVVIRHGLGRVVAVIELVSPGNKDSANALRSFVTKACDLLNQGIHLVIVDLFPPTPRDPQGLHKAIWDEFEDVPFPFLPDKPLTVASYVGGDDPTAYVESVGVGDALPPIPLFLTEDEDYVPCPLEATYMEAWATLPPFLQELVETPGAG